MTLNKIIEEVKKDPFVIWYYIQGNLRWLIHGRAITKFIMATKQCPECFKSNECKKGCGCDFRKVALTNKCKK